jgi:hypothetical protein
VAKQFYTDKDIEELHRNGGTSLQMTDQVVLTDLAYEKARRLGLQLLDCAGLPPAAPVRPYLSEGKPLPSTPKTDPVSSTIPPLPSGEGRGGGGGIALEKRIREKVAAQLGAQIDPQLLDAILKRTLTVLGMK